MNQWIEPYKNTSWSGKGELWLDPLGNETVSYDCALEFTDEAMIYHWSYKSESKQGRYQFTADQVTWSDTWHQPEIVVCQRVKTTRGLFNIEYSYAEEGDQSWGWRMQLSQRPDDALVLQMTNIAPWGEETRAVRMTFTQT